MKEFLQRIATILEVDAVGASDELRAFAQWDSLALLSTIAMLDGEYRVNLTAADFENIRTVDDLWNTVQARKRP
ncbi:MAG: acyl carrier protein [Opitutaceae bacterium]|nr:acyl carrier protein [Opitutaceae bacterium]